MIFFAFCIMAINTKEHIGQKIKAIRTIKNITQEGLGEKIWKTRALISYLERTCSVNEYTFKEIAEALI